MSTSKLSFHLVVPEQAPDFLLMLDKLTGTNNRLMGIVDNNNPTEVEYLQTICKALNSYHQMLDALKAVLNDLPCQPTEQTYDMVESAIAKAENL